MEEQYKKTFDQMVDSLKMYQRYELKDKNRKDILDKVYVDPIEKDRKSTRLNSSHPLSSRMPSSA